MTEPFDRGDDSGYHPTRFVLAMLAIHENGDDVPRANRFNGAVEIVEEFGVRAWADEAGGVRMTRNTADTIRRLDRASAADTDFQVGNLYRAITATWSAVNDLRSYRWAQDGEPTRAAPLGRDVLHDGVSRFRARAEFETVAAELGLDDELAQRMLEVGFTGVDRESDRAVNALLDRFAERVPQVDDGLRAEHDNAGDWSARLLAELGDVEAAGQPDLLADAMLVRAGFAPADPEWREGWRAVLAEVTAARLDEIADHAPEDGRLAPTEKAQFTAEAAAILTESAREEATRAREIQQRLADTLRTYAEAEQWAATIARSGADDGAREILRNAVADLDTDVAVARTGSTRHVQLRIAHRLTPLGQAQNQYRRRVERADQVVAELAPADLDVSAYTAEAATYTELDRQVQTTAHQMAREARQDALAMKEWADAVTADAGRGRDVLNATAGGPVDPTVLERSAAVRLRVAESLQPDVDRARIRYGEAAEWGVADSLRAACAAPSTESETDAQRAHRLNAEGRPAAGSGQGDSEPGREPGSGSDRPDEPRRGKDGRDRPDDGRER